jgi:hypothetical protein
MRSATASDSRKCCFVVFVGLIFITWCGPVSVAFSGLVHKSFFFSFRWNYLPSTRLEAARMAVPISCMYTPLKPIEGLATVNYQPILCKVRYFALCGC